VRYALLFVALFVPYTYFNHSDGWNQGARLAELHAVVLKGTLRIDDYLAYTGDRALIGGHYYSEKAPAMTVAALPAFAVTVWIEKAVGVDPDGEQGKRISDWVATAFSAGALAALGGVAFFALADAHLGRLAAVIATFGVFLGTIAWPYAAALFAHAGTMGLLCIALWAALGARPRDLIAGVAAGFAVASEYPAIVPGAVLGLYLGALDWRRMVRYGLATLPAAALILLNNYAVSGSPFELGYGSNPLFPELTATNTFGFNTPDPGAMRSLLSGEYRGLLFWNPILLMSVPGFFMLFKTQRRLAFALLAGILLVLLQVSSFYSWFGGNAIGPRYLAPAIPLFALAAAYGAGRFPEMGAILAVASIAMMLMVTAIAIDPPGDALTPLQSFYLARIEQHRFATNLGTLAGLPLVASLIVPLVLPAVAAWHLLREGA
jgi:hypothetical protein